MPRVHFANSSPTRVPMSDSEEHLNPKPKDEKMLRLLPSEVIVLDKTEDSTEGELTGTVKITCTSRCPITYKIKTTSPLKFRVRPSSGALLHGNSAFINVILQPGKQVSAVSKDKFLVMCTALPEEIDVSSTQLIAEFWKALPPNSPNVQQYRLQCVCSQNEQGDQMLNGHVQASSSSDLRIRQIDTEVSHLTMSLSRVEKQMKLSVNLHWLSLLVFIMVSIALTYIIKLEIQEQNQGSCTRFQ